MLNNSRNKARNPSEIGMGKSIAVLAIVVGCFTILWPKIFYPMMQAAFSLTSPNHEQEEAEQLRRDRPPHLVPGTMHPRMKEAMGESRASDRPPMREGRPFPHPSVRQPPKPQPKTGGAMNIIMPLYTIGIIVFFLYTVLKLVCKNKPEDEKKPLIQDFHFDPNHHRYLFTEDAEQNAFSKYAGENKKKKSKPGTKQVLEEFGRNNKDTEPIPSDEKDHEIYQLKRRLEETEAAMERIMKHMGCVSERLAAASKISQPPTRHAQAEEMTEEEETLQNAHTDNSESQAFDKKKMKLTSKESSPDVESYEIINGSTSTSPLESPTDDLEYTRELEEDEDADDEGTSPVQKEPPVKIGANPNPECTLKHRKHARRNKNRGKAKSGNVPGLESLGNCRQVIEDCEEEMKLNTKREKF